LWERGTGIRGDFPEILESKPRREKTTRKGEKRKRGIRCRGGWNLTTSAGILHT